MAEGLSRPIALALAVIDSKTSDSILVPGEPEPNRVPVTITFDRDGGALGLPERQAAYELNSAIEALNASRTIQGLLGR